MSDHTPEPWTADIPYIHAGDTEENIVEVLGDRMSDEVWANARRIVACVNACKGVPTEALEAAQYLFFSDLSMGEDAHVTLTKWNAALRQQVADLRAALAEHEDASRSYLMDADRANERRLERALIASTRVLAATKPQEVQP